MPYFMTNRPNAGRLAHPAFDTLVFDRFWRPVIAGSTLTKAIESTPNPLRIVRRGKLRDIFGTEGAWIVRREVKEIIEELEPGTHGFIPVTVKEDRSNKDLGEFFIIHITQALDAVVIEETNFAEGRGHLGFAKSKSCISHLIFEVTLDGDRVAGLHLWRGARGVLGTYTPFSNAFFCSDALRDLMLTGGLYGVDFRKCRLKNAVVRGDLA